MSLPSVEFRARRTAIGVKELNIARNQICVYLTMKNLVSISPSSHSLSSHSMLRHPINLWRAHKPQSGCVVDHSSTCVSWLPCWGRSFRGVEMKEQKSRPRGFRSISMLDGTGRRAWHIEALARWANRIIAYQPFCDFCVAVNFMRCSYSVRRSIEVE